MPPRLVTDAQLVDRLSALFRTAGYDGASIGDIALATGLQKSSLYHRFPGGKQQMAAEVAAAAGAHFATAVLAPLDGDAPLAERIRAVGRNLEAFYEGGARGCVLDMLSVGEPGADASAGLAAAAEGWIGAFAAAAREAGADTATSIARAQDAVAAIEGSLVVARVTGDRRPFSRAIERLGDVLIGRTPS